MKYIQLNALFLTFVFPSSYGQNQTNAAKNNTWSETKDIVTSYGFNNPDIQPKYEYAYLTTEGASGILRTGLSPKG